jgi:hypothetical protein
MLAAVANPLRTESQAFMAGREAAVLVRPGRGANRLHRALGYVQL